MKLSDQAAYLAHEIRVIESENERLRTELKRLERHFAGWVVSHPQMMPSWWTVAEVTDEKGD